MPFEWRARTHRWRFYGGDAEYTYIRRSELSDSYDYQLPPPRRAELDFRVAAWPLDDPKMFARAVPPANVVVIVLPLTELLEE